MEKSYKIFDILEKNISDCFDILIFNPIFFTVNIENVQMYLLGEEGSLSNELDGLKYEIIISGSSIFYGIVSTGENLFKFGNIPFSYNIFHKALLIIYNLPNDIVKKILNYTIKFKYNLDVNLPTYLTGQIPTNPYEMKWNCGIYETNEDKNKLRFMGGMSGMSGMSFRPNHQTQYISDNYLENNKKIFYHDDNFENNKYLILNVSHLDNFNNWVNDSNSECDVYSVNKLLDLIVHEKIPDGSDLFYTVISDTKKIPLWTGKFIRNDNDIIENKDKQIYKYKYSFYDKPDAISNIKFICDNNKYVFLDVRLFLSDIPKIGETVNGVAIYGDITFETEHEYELEFVPTEYGYVITGLNNFLIIPTINSIHTIIEIKFYLENKINDNLLYENKTDFWIKYDRYIMDTVPRRNIAQDSLNWEEFPIIDLVEYLPDYNNQIFNIPNNMIPIPNILANPNNIPINNMIPIPNIPANPNNIPDFIDNNENDGDNNINKDESNKKNDYEDLIESTKKYNILTETILYSLTILMIIITIYFD